MSKKPLVSVVTPFKDNIEEVQECVDSLKRQSYRNIEIILISDKIKWTDKDRRVKCIYIPNFKGVGYLRNLAVKYANGSILFFLDSDCTVKPKTITTLIKMFDEIETDAISGKTLAPEKGNLLGIATGLEYEDRFNRMGENYVSIAATTCLAIRKEAFKSIAGFKDYSLKEPLGEDWDFSRRFTSSGYKIFHTNKIQVHHNHASDSVKTWLKRRISHSSYRVTHKRKYGEMFEEYTSRRMFIDTSILLCIPVALRMYKESGRWEAFSLPIFAFLRNFVWFIGMIKGLTRRNKKLMKK